MSSTEHLLPDAKRLCMEPTLRSTGRLETVLVVLLFVLATPTIACAGDPPEERPPSETVILLHGLGRSSGSMKPLAADLEDRGFRVVNFGYPSTEEPPESLVARLDDEIESCCLASPKLHFVGHSLGGILVRAYLAETRPSNLGRLVMLGPPNKGSELIDEFGDSALFEWAMGPTALLLGTSADSLPNSLPAPTIEVGIIAGTGTVNPIGSVILPDEDDGMVSLERTKLEGMADFLVVPDSHALIMRSREVARQVALFLRTGHFDHSEPRD